VVLELLLVVVLAGWEVVVVVVVVVMVVWGQLHEERMKTTIRQRKYTQFFFTT